jgi:hypothetical protein
MKKTLSENQKLIVKKAISLIAVFAVLVIAFVAVSTNWSFGWFSQNKDVSANGMSVQTDIPSVEVYYRILGATDWIEINRTDPIDVASTLTAPGLSVTFEVKIVNKSDYAITVREFGFATPTGSEESTNDAGVWLSTELYTTLEGLKVGGTDYTLNAPTLGENAVCLRTGEINFMKHVNDSSNVTLSPEGDAVFKISILFLNRKTSQNAFKNFGKNGDGACSRRFYFTYDW